MRRLWPLLFAIVSLAAGQESPAWVTRLLVPRVVVSLGRSAKVDLKLDPGQIREINESFGGFLAVDGDDVIVKPGAGRETEEMEREAMECLDETQQKRVVEIWVQEMGGLVLGDEQVSKSLKLSDKQRAEVERLMKEAVAKLDALSAEEKDNPLSENQVKIRKGCAESLLGLLDEKQKRGFEGIKGPTMKRIG